MDKQAFKQRMQNLKSYQENNPGKGYWDWRNSLPDNLKYTDDTEYNMRGAYESGAQPILENDGFYHLPTRNPQTGEILKTSLHPTFWKGLAEDAKIGYNTYFVGDKVYTKSKEEGPINVYTDGGEVARKSLKDIRKESIIEDKLDYDVMLQNQNAYQKEFATNWYKERAKNPKYSSQLGDGKLDKILSDIDKATWKNPTEAMRDNLISQGYTPTDQNIKSQLQAINAKGTKGFAVPSMYSYYGAPRNTWHEGVGHIVGDNNPAILDSTPNINIPSNDPQYSDYVNQANEKHAQTWDFRGKNQTLKDDTGNYYIDPNRQLSSDDIQEMIDKGAVIPDQWKDITTQDISDLTNTFAYNYAEGGEVGNPDDDFTKAINTKLGRTPDGRPKEQGLKPVFDLENAANITPIGDALSARDVYNAVTEKDWTGAGLAALGILPFIPSGLRQLKPTARYIPSVSRSREQDLLNAAFDNIKQKREYLSDVANERNRVLESVNDYAHRVRAEKADQMFGTNYSDTYKLLSDLYEHKFFSLPEVQGIDMKEIGKMQAKDQANKNFIKTGIGAGPEDFDFLVNPYRPMAADELARHELNHYTDFIISRNRDTSTNNNMLKQLEASLKKTNDVKDDYFKLGTEQKAYMNQLRTRMYNDKAISSLEEPVSTALPLVTVILLFTLLSITVPIVTTNGVYKFSYFPFTFTLFFKSFVNLNSIFTLPFLPAISVGFVSSPSK